MKKLKMSANEYHRHPAIGSSSVKILIDETPAHYLYKREHPEESTLAQKFGQIIHTALLEPDVFANLAIVEPEFSGKGSREAKDNWHTQYDGRIILKRDQMIQIDGLIKALKAHPIGMKCLAHGRAEDSIFWTNPETGIECKGRFDFTHENKFLVDVKTTTSVQFHSFQKDVANYGYHVQAAHYLEGAQLVLGSQFTDFLILAIEKDAPHCCRIFRIDESALNEAKALRYKALKELAHCLKTKVFPGYSQEIVSLDLPVWAYKMGEQ